jgi:TonB family protein
MKDDGNQHVHISGRQRVVTVYLTVNEAGQPTDLNIPEPVDDALDVEVLATVGKFRYKPATLDGKPISMAVHMHYVVPVGAVY